MTNARGYYALSSRVVRDRIYTIWPFATKVHFILVNDKQFGQVFSLPDVCDYAVLECYNMLSILASVALYNVLKVSGDEFVYLFIYWNCLYLFSGFIFKSEDGALAVHFQSGCDELCMRRCHCHACQEEREISDVFFYF